MGGSGTAVKSPDGAGAARAAGEARLAHQAAEGDGAAFAALYDRYELAVFNVCARVLPTPDEAAVATQRAFLDELERWPHATDGEFELDLGLLGAAHGACADGAERDAPEARNEVDANGSQPAPERYVDPERAEQLASLQEDVGRANQRLSETHRELLALRDLEGLSYDQISGVTGADRRSVIESLARARVNLQDALRDSSLAQQATATPECERGLTLLAMRIDGQLDDRAERDWLQGHVGACETCRASLNAMQEARIAYRAWLPLLPPPWLRIDTLAEADQRGGADSAEVGEGAWAPPPANGAVTALRATGAAAAPAPSVETDFAPGDATSPLAVAVAASRGGRERDRERRRRVVLAILVPVVLLAGIAAAVLAANGASGGKRRVSRPAASSARIVPATAATPTPQPGTHRVRKRRKQTAARTSGQALRTTPTQPTTRPLPPPTTSNPAPVSRAPRRTTQQQPPQSIGGGSENRTPRQPAPSRPMPTPANPTPPAPTGTIGNNGSSTP